MRRRDRRGSLALVVSAALHGLFGMWLLASTLQAGAGSGRVQGVAGPGLAVSLVTAPPASTNAPSQAESKSPPAEQASPVDPTPEKPVEPPLNPSLPTPTKASAPPPQSEQVDQAAASSSAPAQSGGGGESDKAGVLAEVARCLPAGLRPRLAFTTLTLAADKDGALSAAPVVTFTGPNTSKEDASTADLIVQAALQCGPYQSASLKGGTLVLPLDFGDLEASPGVQATR